MKHLEKDLSLHFEFIDNRCEVTVLEPESGTTKSIVFTADSEADKYCFHYEIGREALSWVDLWMDEIKEIDEIKEEEEK